MGYGTCTGCGEGRSVNGDGTMRRHPKGASVPCSGSEKPPAADSAEFRRERGRRVIEAGVEGAYAAGVALGQHIKARGGDGATASPREPIAAAPGVYRSREPMLAPGEPVPDGHAVLSIIAYFPYDASVRSPADEAALLFEDPGYLSRVLDAVPNDRVRIQMKVE